MSIPPQKSYKGRGALDNPTGRFEKLSLVPDADLSNEDLETGQKPRIATEVFRDATKTIISTNDSPDLGMDTTVNPYRGCEHGCIYCYARPGHEYLGLSAGLDFETKIFAKPDAPLLLERALQSRHWQPRVVTFSGVTDCYQPLERRMRLTRDCIKVLRDFRNPVAVITKNQLVTRDVDLYAELAAFQASYVSLSITTLENHISRVMEPRASIPALRLRAVETLAKAGVPVGIMIGPVVPGLTDHEIPAILKSAADAGARSAHYTMIRLPYGVKDLFQDWAQEHFPDRAQKILNRIQDMRGGRFNDPDFGTRMTGTGFYAEQVAQIFTLYKKRFNLTRRTRLSAAHFRPGVRDAQGSLF